MEANVVIGVEMPVGSSRLGPWSTSFNTADDVAGKDGRL
jgi:hypothetical protein